MDLDSTPYVILDVETTGLSPKSGDRICEIGAIKILGGNEIDRFESLVHPEREIPAEAQATHQISDEMVKDAPSWAVVGPKFRPFLAGTIVVAQNADFDVGFLNAEFVRIGMSKLALPAVDTIALARRFRPGLPTYRLDSLAQHFGLANRSRHRSMGDCEVTVKIFLECLSGLRRRGDIRSVAELVKKGAGRS